ncbi:MAG: hypothetical protein Q9170_004952 [Blastenia crenularia]
MSWNPSANFGCVNLDAKLENAECVVCFGSTSRCTPTGIAHEKRASEVRSFANIEVVFLE